MSEVCRRKGGESAGMTHAVSKAENSGMSATETVGLDGIEQRLSGEETTASHVSVLHEYKHSSLNNVSSDVRLFTLCPVQLEDDDQIIRGRIKVRPLLTAKYEALCYEWGNSEAGREIIVGGHRLFVRENL